MSSGKHKAEKPLLKPHRVADSLTSVTLIITAVRREIKEVFIVVPTKKGAVTPPRVRCRAAWFRRWRG